MVKIRRIINLIIYVLLAPVVGHEEACRYIASGEDKEDRKFLTALMSLRMRGYLSPKSIEEYLISISRNYEISNVESSIHFEYLFMKLEEYLGNLKKSVTDLYTALLTGVIGIYLFSIIVMFLVSNILLKILTLIIPLAFLPIVHTYQPDIDYYKYTKPLTISISSSIPCVLICYILHIDVPVMILISILIFSITFSIFYTPQLFKIFRLLLNIKTRILNPLHELMWNPMNVKIIEMTRLECEINRVVELGKKIGAPWFIARINRLIDMFISTILSILKNNFMYGIFIPIGYILLLYTLCIVHSVSLGKIVIMNLKQTNIPFMYYIINAMISFREKINLYIYSILGSIVTSIVTGKSMYSIGLGLMIIPILLLISMYQLGVL